MRFYCLACRGLKDSDVAGEPNFTNAEVQVEGAPGAFCPDHSLEDCWRANRRYQELERGQRRRYRDRNRVKLTRPKQLSVWYGEPGSYTRRRALELFRRVPKQAWAEVAMHALARGSDDGYDVTMHDGDKVMDLAVTELRNLAKQGLV